MIWNENYTESRLFYIPNDSSQGRRWKIETASASCREKWDRLLCASLMTMVISTYVIKKNNIIYAEVIEKRVNNISRQRECNHKLKLKEWNEQVGPRKGDGWILKVSKRTVNQTRVTPTYDFFSFVFFIPLTNHWKIEYTRLGSMTVAYVQPFGIWCLNVNRNNVIDKHYHQWLGGGAHIYQTNVRQSLIWHYTRSF